MERLRTVGETLAALEACERVFIDDKDPEWAAHGGRREVSKAGQLEIYRTQNTAMTCEELEGREYFGDVEDNGKTVVLYD